MMMAGALYDPLIEAKRMDEWVMEKHDNVIKAYPMKFKQIKPISWLRKTSRIVLQYVSSCMITSEQTILNLKL